MEEDTKHRRGGDVWVFFVVFFPSLNVKKCRYCPCGIGVGGGGIALSRQQMATFSFKETLLELQVSLKKLTANWVRITKIRHVGVFF